MDFVIGQVPSIGKAGEDKADGAVPIEARILHIRPPRRSRPPVGRTNTRQGNSPQADPPGSRVLVLLVPDGFRLPDDLNERDYRIFLRVRRR